MEAVVGQLLDDPHLVVFKKRGGILTDEYRLLWDQMSAIIVSGESSSAVLISVGCFLCGLASVVPLLFSPDAGAAAITL